VKVSSTFVFLACGLLATAACSTSSLGSRQVICSQSPSRTYASVDEVPLGEWIDLLFDEQQRGKDCSGQSFAPTSLPLRCAKAARPGTARDLQIRADELSIEPLPDGFGLVWLPVEEFSNGDRTLLVALVHTSKRANSVLGIGTVRLPPEQMRVELQAVRGEELLFAQGAECGPGVDSGKCNRMLKLLLLHDGRFVPLEIRDADNQCQGEAAINLARSQQMRLKSGWIRRFELVSTYEITDDGLLVNEQLAANDLPPDGNDANPRLFRKSDATRVLEFSGAYFSYTRESLWTGMREVRGDLQTNKSQTFAE
jgi:hypothetical protein